jgi:hypothetical protein
MITRDDIEHLVDYAMPLMNIERMSRKIHDLCLDRRYAEARELTLALAAEARILRASLDIMESSPTPWMPK